MECEQAALLLQADGWQRNSIQVLAGEKVADTIGPLAVIDPAFADPYAAFYTAVTTGQMTPTSIDPAFADPYAAFYTAVTTGQMTPTSIEVNIKTIQWIDAAVQSLHTGNVVQLK